MTTIQIEKNIPITKDTRGRAKGSFLCIESKTLVACEIGDSFLVDDKCKRNAVQTLARNYSIKICTRQQGEKYRIWRTA